MDKLRTKYYALQNCVTSSSFHAPFYPPMCRYQEIKQELDDVNADNQREREELLETIRELTRHIQLKVREFSFVPPNSSTQLLNVCMHV